MMFDLLRAILFGQMLECSIGDIPNEHDVRLWLELMFVSPKNVVL